MALKELSVWIIVYYRRITLIHHMCPFHRGDPIEYFLHEQPVYSLSIDPCNDNVFASACDDGRILIYDIREPSSSGKTIYKVYKIENMKIIWCS